MKNLHTYTAEGSQASLDVLPYTDELVEYLLDESKLDPEAVNEIFLPKTTAEISTYLKKLQGTAQRKVYISGASTGVTGAKVPMNTSGVFSSVISTKRLNSIGGVEELESGATITIGSGVSLAELEAYLNEKHPKYCFPVDPTEKWASFGGMLATNASGARGYKYGSVRNWIQAATFVLSDGRVLKLKRGEDVLENGRVCLDGSEIEFVDIPKPKTKHSLGFVCESNGDILDLFIGSEGTLGICTELEILLIDKPYKYFSFVQFFDEAQKALSLVKSLRGSEVTGVVSIEMLDEPANTYAVKSDFKACDQIKSFLKSGISYSVFCEFEVSGDDELESTMAVLMELVEKAGGDIEQGLCGIESVEVDDLKKYRHAVPENINATIAQIKRTFPACRKVATDMSVPDDSLEHVYQLYKSSFSNLEHIVMGHAGNNHFHVNIIPKDKKELNGALEVYAKLADEVVALGGAVSAEHGIGRIKKDFLKIQYTPKQLAEMQKIKSFFDPEGILNPGVMIDE